MNDERTDEEHEQLLLMEHHAQMFAQVIDRCTADDVGFCLCLFQFNGSNLTYVSNTERSDMILALKELIMQLEANTVAEPGSNKDHPAFRRTKQ